MKEKLHLTASIHTLSLKFKGIIGKMQDKIRDCVQSSYFAENELSSCKVNVHRLYGDIFKYSEFRTALDTIMVDAGIKDYQITRVDMRFDSYDKEDYKRYSKLFRLLLSLMGATYSTRKNYQCTDLFTDQQLSLSVRNDYFQIEYYDKNRQSGGRDKAKSRFEIRSLKKKIQIEELQDDFWKEWNYRFEKAIKRFEEVQMKYNRELELLYKQDKQACPRKYKNLNSFLLQYQECIYTKEQLIDLVRRFDEVKNPENRAKNFKQKYGIEYCNMADIQAAVHEIKRAVDEFFNS